MKKFSFIINGSALAQYVCAKLDGVKPFIEYNMEQDKRMTYKFHVQGQDDAVKFVSECINNLKEEFDKSKRETIAYDCTMTNFDYIAPLMKDYFGKTIKKPIFGKRKKIYVHDHPLVHQAFQSAASEFCSINLKTED